MKADPKQIGSRWLPIFVILIMPWAASTKDACADVFPEADQAIPATYTSETGQIFIAKDAYVHGGKPINLAKFRAPEILNETGTAGKSGASIKIKGFLHDKKFHNATFDLSEKAIDKVYVQSMPFPILPGVMAGHVQIRFVMKPGYEIQLVDEKNPEIMSSVRDFIVSYEAALPPDGSYNFLLGAVNSNPLVGRVVSGEQKLYEGPDRIFNQFQIPIADSEKSLLLQYFIKNTAEIGMRYYYNTVTKNCTTTIFDGLDSLPSLATKRRSGEISPFLTNVGGDPVIGPSVIALLERFGNDVRQVQDMKDEYKGQFADLGVPEKPVTTRLPFAPGGEHPMTLVVLTTNTDHLTPKQKAQIKTLVDGIIESLPETMNMLMASSFSVASDLKGSADLLQAVTSTISTRLSTRLKETGLELPTKPVGIHIAFTPYPATDAIKLTDRGFRAHLPFALVRQDLSNRNQRGIISEIEKGISEVDSRASNEIPAYLKSLGVRLHLEERANQPVMRVDTQVLIGFAGRSHQLTVENEQVLIDQLSIPDSQNRGFIRRAWDYIRGNEVAPRQSVNVLLSHRQDLNKDPNPSVHVQFGADTDVARRIENVGQMTVRPTARNRFLCWSGRDPHVPTLSGTLTEAPMGQGRFARLINRVIGTKPVALSITELDFNLESMQLDAVRIRVGIMGLRCLDFDKINQQFGDAANEKLDELVKKFGQPQIPLTAAD